MTSGEGSLVLHGHAGGHHAHDLRCWGGGGRHEKLGLAQSA